MEEARADVAAQISVLPLRAHPAIQGKGVPSYVLDWFDHDQPGEYWSSLDISRSLHKIAVPALHVSGWYDTFLHGSIDGFLALCDHAANNLACKNQYLIAGPWVHIPWGDRIGAGDLGCQALLDTDGILLQWFNHWLMDSGEFASEPKVRHFVLGENRWRTADAWPRDAIYALYLHSGGKANSRKGDGQLCKVAPRIEEPPDVFVYRSSSAGSRAGWDLPLRPGSLIKLRWRWAITFSSTRRSHLPSLFGFLGRRASGFIVRPHWHAPISRPNSFA